MISFNNFNQVYQSVVSEIIKIWTPQMQNEISFHNIEWNPEHYCFENYLRKSVVRYYIVYNHINHLKVKSICDIGGFLGVFPILMKRMGYDVTMTEALKYYNTSFDLLFEKIKNEGVEILDFDPFDNTNIKIFRKFDFITVMAVIEHYPHSLKPFMDVVTSLLKENGKLYIEVPNIAYWPKRIKLFLKGETPISNFESIYNSKIPFIGHHHEYTMAELRMLAKLSNLDILKEHYYNYSVTGFDLFKSFIKNPLLIVGLLFLKNSFECISVLCKSRSNKINCDNS